MTKYVFHARQTRHILYPCMVQNEKELTHAMFESIISFSLSTMMSVRGVTYGSTVLNGIVNKCDGITVSHGRGLWRLVYIVTTRHTNHCTRVIDIFITVIIIYIFRPGVLLFSPKRILCTSHVRCCVDSKGPAENYCPRIHGPPPTLQDVSCATRSLPNSEKTT